MRAFARGFPCGHSTGGATCILNCSMASAMASSRDMSKSSMFSLTVSSNVSCEMRFICVMPPFLLGGGKLVRLGLSRNDNTVAFPTPFHHLVAGGGPATDSQGGGLGGMADGWADGAVPAAAGAAGAAESEEAKQKKAMEALKQKIVTSAKQMIEEKEKVRSPRGVGRVRWRPACLPQARLGRGALV